MEKLLTADRESGGILDDTAEPSHPAPHPPGDVLAGRFEIVRFLAAGGMGEVYEAIDRELGERVAIKILQPRLLRDDTTLERFRREVQLARRVTHPSVCRTFDLFVHSPEGEGERLYFLTMELVEGETLAQRLERRGRLTPAETLPIARKIADALATAHEAGIVHRDLKSANVLLAPGREGGEERVVITDFGIAHLGPKAAGDPGNKTRTGLMLGTPAYMAPEQITGDPVTPATDVYAFGVLLYEMTTGRRPFAADTPAEEAYRRLEHSPAAPRKIVPDLDPEWQKVILRCLERRPARRYQNPRDAIAELEPRYRWSRPALAALAAVAALLLLVFLFGPGRPGTSPAPQAPATTTAPSTADPRPVVAFLDFHNSNDREEAAWLSAALPEMLAVELAARPALRIVEGERVERALRDLEVSAAPSYAASRLESIGHYLGCDYLVLGSYLDLGAEGSIRLDVRIEKADGVLFDSFTLTADSTALLEMLSEAGQGLRRAFGIDTGGPGGLPDRETVTRLYAEGLALLRRHDPVGARALLRRAAEIDPTALPVWQALAASQWRLGDFTAATETARRTLELARSPGRDVARVQLLELEERVARGEDRNEDAIEILRELRTLEPDDPTVIYRLALSYNILGRPRESLDLLREARSVPGTRNDPRLAYFEADSLHLLGRLEEALEAATEAEAGARSRGDRTLLGEILTRKGWTLYRSGYFEASEEAAAEAEDLARQLGDEHGVGASRNLRGAAALAAGRLEEAEGFFRGAAERFEAATRRGDAAAALGNVALVQEERGDLHNARRTQEEVLGISRALGARQLTANTLLTLGDLALRQGQLRHAREQIEEGLALGRKIGNPITELDGTVRLARLEIALGHLGEAEELLGGAVERARELDQPTEEARALASLADLELLRGSLAAARGHAEAAMDIGEIETGILQSVRLTHAEVLLAAGESEAAGVLAREVLETAAGESSEAARRGRALLARLEAAERPEEALRRLETVLAGRPPEALGERAHLTRLEILLDIGRPAEAHREREGLATTPIQDLAVRLRLDLASARLEDLRGDPETARRRFDLVIVEAQEAGLLPLALEARARRALLEEDTKTGLRHFDEALEQAEALGLGHLVGVLRALDARTTPPGDQ